VEIVTLDHFAAPQADALLAQALDASYVGTQDCPALCGMRTTADVIESHKAVGQFDPRLWFLVMISGQPVGCMLLSCAAGPETAELVYLGLGPVARGRGIAAALLDLGMQRLESRSEATLACAVDTRNAPALRLYRRAKFKRFATRVALVRSLRSA
jgi:ribosomal protein S18 acetylase RimI-like enzyme